MIVIKVVKMTNLLSRDVAADMGLVCRLEQVDTSGDDDGRTGRMKTEPITIKLKAGAEPLCLTTARRVPFPLMDAVKTEFNNMVKSGVIRSVTEPTLVHCDGSGLQENRCCAYLRRLEATEYSSST